MPRRQENRTPDSDEEILVGHAPHGRALEEFVMQKMGLRSTFAFVVVVRWLAVTSIVVGAEVRRPEAQSPARRTTIPIGLNGVPSQDDVKD